MKINFNDIPKFLINLDRRKDRLKSVTEEFQYMGWTFERFSAVDTNSYEGCAYSHQKIAKLILERGYEYAMVFEDVPFVEACRAGSAVATTRLAARLRPQDTRVRFRMQSVAGRRRAYLASRIIGLRPVSKHNAARNIENSVCEH